jgi:hypothetical protein
MAAGLTRVRRDYSRRTGIVGVREEADREVRVESGRFPLRDADHPAPLTEASLSFLGLGVPPPYPTWGGMLSLAGLDNMYRAPWLAIWPAVALSLAVFGFNMLGDALRDLLDPRLKGG